MHFQPSFSPSINFTQTIKMSGNSAAELSISHVLVDGNIAAISGKMKMKNGHIFGFTDIYTQVDSYSSITTHILSYVIQLPV